MPATDPTAVPSFGAAGRLEQRTALITGAASGIGAGIATRFAAEGAAVCLVGHAGQADRLGQVEAAITAAGGSAICALADARDEAATEEAVAAAIEEFGSLDVAVASAGVERHPEAAERGRGLLDGRAEHFTYVLDINLTGVWLTLRAAGRRMRDLGQGGSLISVASVAAKKPAAAAYSVSKTGTWMLTRVLAEELGPAGVRANCLAPGMIETKMLRHRAAAEGDADAWLAKRANGLAMRKIGTVEDCAQVALFLAGDGARYVTGAILHPDGGYISAYAGG